MKPRTIVVSVGTDVHPFPRLIEWAERLAERHPEAEVVVQFGTSPQPRGAALSVRATDRETLLAWYADADVVITQGGPGSILDVRAAGRIPLVVPRDPAQGEHVDGHQLAFVPVMAEAGHAVLVRDESHLVALVEARLAEPALAAAAPRLADPEPAGRALSVLVERARTAGRRRGTLLRRTRSLLGPRSQRSKRTGEAASTTGGLS